MSPSPETFGPVVPRSSDDMAASNNDMATSNNQYTNNAFIKDETPDNSSSMETKTADVAVKRPNSENDTDSLDFDDILPHIGEFGTYQKILFFLMIPFAFFVAFVYFSQIFITLVPEKHWCLIYELEHLPVEQR